MHRDEILRRGGDLVTTHSKSLPPDPSQSFQTGHAHDLCRLEQGLIGNLLTCHTLSLPFMHTRLSRTQPHTSSLQGQQRQILHTHFNWIKNIGTFPPLTHQHYHLHTRVSTTPLQ